MNKKKVYSTTITSLENSMPPLLDAADLPGCIGKEKTVLIKPNLVKALAPPVTTPVRLTQLLIVYLQERKENLRIIIGEGTGSLEYDTHYPFQMLGYTKLAGCKIYPTG